ncbi:MAG: hypothetical protein MRERV_10c036 [Mycoplasmataceae bacterium RV_VA103A]|nr:MAG: hypothetical protein MRERV_10c036 [Mycoplasmataceae bacterium RV_VA103A]
MLESFLVEFLTGKNKFFERFKGKRGQLCLKLVICSLVNNF